VGAKKSDSDLATSAISIMIKLGLVGAFDGNADVGGLIGGELGEFRPDFLEVETGHFLVELFGKMERRSPGWYVSESISP
jgi:hypothetical protein